MLIEAGLRYVRRDGALTGAARATGKHPYAFSVDSIYYTSEGRFDLTKENIMDLVKVYEPNKAAAVHDVVKVTGKPKQKPAKAPPPPPDHPIEMLDMQIDQLISDNSDTSTSVQAHAILTTAADHMTKRAATYDAPEGERSMAKTVDVFNLHHGTELTEAQGWHFMQILKDVRLFSSASYHADSAEDCVAYAALKAEAKSKEGKKNV